MRKESVRTEAEALVYLVDCTLATVCDMAMKKSRPVYQYKRHISIAQTGVTWITQMGIDPSGTRSADVIRDYAGSVQEWAAKFEEDNRL